MLIFELHMLSGFEIPGIREWIWEKGLECWIVLDCEGPAVRGFQIRSALDSPREDVLNCRVKGVVDVSRLDFQEDTCL